MAQYGRIGEFDPEKEDWDLYVECLAHYFAVNDINEDKKQKAILLSVIGVDAYKLLRNLVMPATPGDKSLDEIVEVMKEHRNLTPSAIVQQYKFNSRNQKCNEGVADFIAELRQIAKHCNYQDKLDEMLRDQLVSGLRNERIQCCLLAEPDLTFMTAKEITVGMETVEKNSHLVTDQSKVTTEGTVNQIHRGKYSPTKTHETKCGRCGRSTWRIRANSRTPHVMSATRNGTSVENVTQKEVLAATPSRRSSVQDRHSSGTGLQTC